MAGLGIIFLMNRRLFLITLPLLLLTLSLFPSEKAGAQPRPLQTNPAAQELIEAINALRDAQGLPSYQIDVRLMEIAQSHAEYIAEKGVLSHFSANGKRPYQRALDAGYPVAGNLSLGGIFAENIHSGIGLTAEDVVQVWQRHSTNSQPLLSEDYKDMGVGVATVKNVTYFVLDVGAADSSNAGAILATESPTSTLPAATGTGGAVVVPNTPQSDGQILHVVRRNEALWSIALAYETTIDELKFLNGLASDEIFEGQTLVIRLASTPTPEPTSVAVEATATFGIPTSTATVPVTATITFTPTPIPTPPATFRSGGMVAGGIILAALIAAGLFSLLGKKAKTSLE